MTEYDYSPAAWQAHIEKQAKIDQWRQDNSLHAPVNPFMQTPSVSAGASDFYKKKSKKSKSSKSRSKGYCTDGGGDSDNDSDYGGPDRPPTPPAMAPFGGGGGGFNPYGPVPLYQQQYSGLPARYPQQAGPGFHLINNATGTPLIPTWTGNSWVYQQPVPSHSHSRSHDHSHSHSRRSMSREGSSHKHRKRRSVPSALPLMMSPAMSPPIYGVGGVPLGGYFTAQPQQVARSPYSASLPTLSSPAMYLPSGHTSPASGVYSLPQQYSHYPQQIRSAGVGGYTVVQMPVSQVPPKSAGVFGGSAYGTVIVDSKKEKGSSFFGRLGKKK